MERSRAYWLWLLIGTLVLVALLAWLLVPKWQVHGFHISDAKQRGELEDNFRKTITQLLAGIAVFVGAGFTYWQFRQQQRTTREQLNQQREAAQALLISNQVSKGFEQLSSDKLAMRLGGIYALEGVMNTSEQYYRPVLEALCAFVRDETRTKTGNEAPATEIQAALTVIGRRKARPWDDIFVNLANAHIPKARLFGNLRFADLSGADLSGAGLYFANLIGADLSGATLTDANLSAADLRGARGLTQEQLDGACGDNTNLDPPLTIKPCPPDQPDAGVSK